MTKMVRIMWLMCVVSIQLFQLCFACQMEGVQNWRLRVEESILDTHIGVVMDRTTTDITGINTIVYSEGLNRGPYIEVKHENSRFTVSTNTSFAEYEEYETSKTMRVTVLFNCAVGSTNQPPLVIQIDIIDTNNNAPRFLPSDIYEFNVIPPLPPGFLVTGCDNQIIARDIDLTTQRVDFAIEENDYFEIFYDTSPTIKEFSASLRAKTFIRSIPDKLSFKIMATDVDDTSGPPLTTIGTVKIIPDTQFQLPEELRFSNVFYILNYLNEEITQENIYLTHGYDNQVLFTFEGDYAEYFDMAPNENRITIRVKSTLPAEILAKQQIYFVLGAEREHTIGTSATIVIQMPPARELSFEFVTYQGRVDDIDLIYPDIFLNEYREDVVFGIEGDNSALFDHSSNGNQLIISLKSQLPQEIVTSNNIITLEVTATSKFTNTAVSTLVFEIIKDDMITPVFDKRVYDIKYLSSTHIITGEMKLTQGYDKTVGFEIYGEHAVYFRIENDDSNVIVSLRSAIPEDVIFSEKIFTLYIVATKPNTVGGNAALVVRFPKELTELAVMEFSKHTYTGTIKKNTVSVENLVLESGYTDQVRFSLSGEYSESFTLYIRENIISVTSNEFDPNLENEEVIILNLRAERYNAFPVTTSIVLNVVKEDIIQPVFEKPYYKGVYTEKEGLQFTDVITLTSGFDATVSFELHGEHSQWFYISQNEATITLHPNITNPIPNDIFITNNQVVLTIVAYKPDTSAGTAVIVIELIPDVIDNTLSFERIYYVGYLDKNSITLDTIKLTGNLDVAYTITLHGDLDTHFRAVEDDGFRIIVVKDLPVDAHGIITLEIRATADSNVARATIVLEVIRDDDGIVQAIRFDHAYYTGEYSNGLSFNQIISLSDGFDDTVEFNLKGDFSQWFYITHEDNSVRLYENSTDTIPNDIVKNNNHIMFMIQANKPGTVSTEAAIHIEIIQEPSEMVLFEHAYYVGSLNETRVILDPIILIGNYDDTSLVSLHGDYANYFSITQRPIFEIILERDASDDLLNNDFVTLEARITKNVFITARTTIILRIIKDNEQPDVVDGVQFERVYYVGRYTEQNVLKFDDTISLSEGYDVTVKYTLEGDESVWFELDQTGETAELKLSEQLPPDVKLKSHLIFEVHANRASDASTAKSTIIITILKDDTSSFLKFEREAYVGTINQSELHVDPIVLTEGYNNEVVFSLVGELNSYFRPSIEQNVVTLILLQSIPEEHIPSNRIITIDIQATSGARVARATIILKIVKNEESIENLSFDKPYYAGSYEDSELSFHSTIRLHSGFDEGIQFKLEGEHSTWFVLRQSGNSASLTLNTAIPEIVLNNNKQLIFVVFAQRLDSDVILARSVIVIDLTNVSDQQTNVKFDKVLYRGRVDDDTVVHEPITVLEFDGNVQVSGEYGGFFRATITDGVITVTLSARVPSTLSYVALKLIADDASAVLLLDISQSDDNTPIVKFERDVYIGTINQSELDVDPIVLTEGYNNEVVFSLIGEFNSYFRPSIEQNVVTLILLQSIPEEHIPSNRIITIDIQATSGARVARATIVLKIVKNEESIENLSFDKPYYAGSYEDSKLSFHSTIRLNSGFDEGIQFKLEGEHSTWFVLRQSGNSASLRLNTAIPEIVLNNNKQLIFVVFAQRLGSDVILARSVIVIELTNDPQTNVKFDKVLYRGRVVDDTVVHEPITVLEFDGNVQVSGEYGELFRATITDGIITVTLSAGVPSTLSYVALKLIADDASAVLLLDISQSDDDTTIVKFERDVYIGTVTQSELHVDAIVLTEGYNNEVVFSLIGEFNSYFRPSIEQNVVTLILLQSIPEEHIPSNRIITIDIQATSGARVARATIVLKIIKNEESIENIIFDQPYYSGSYEDSELSFHSTIRLHSGFDEGIQFKLEGEHSTWFVLRQSGNSASLRLNTAIPEIVLNNNKQLIFVVFAQRLDSDVILARSVIVIDLTNDPQTNVKFDKVLYRGRVDDDTVVHEPITVLEFDGNVQVSGEYGEFFRATITDGVITVTLSARVPSTLSYVALKLIADDASAVLLLDISQSDIPVNPPSVSFSSSSYILEAVEGSTGVVGRVSATADNGESIIYTLEIENEHLKQRLTVNGNGEIHLSAAAALNTYNFKATARARISQATASAEVHLTIIEGGQSFNLPPLLVLERDEEEPHLNLVSVDRTKYPNCEYSLTNKWPMDQNWLYVDSDGLHTRSIDREHESIAFMPVSQIQVELNLNCNKRRKRATKDYGSNKWLLTDGISYNSRRTLVNLIVNDINDNAPKFESDSVTVGYPSDELAEVVLPRALAELKATDADIEENALLRYMSSDERIVVSPATGSVHLRNHVTLSDNARLVVDAVDRNGAGLTGSVEIMVRLLNRNHIAVLTVTNKFLDDEVIILDDLTKAVGYEVKPLRTTVISESRYDNEGDKSRVRRDVNTNGASLRLYVYGLTQREPVDVTQLTNDLSNANIVTVSLARILSLEDHLDEQQICPAFERDVGLLAATIVLSVLLLIVITAVGVWFYLQRKIAKDYDNFSDQNSLRSRNDSIESPKVEPIYTTPRLNIEELRKSEKKLQERLEAPKEAAKSNEDIVVLTESDSKWPIVIQSIDKLKDNGDEDDDEFGEVERPRRKSVVTFNENVEKIIHLEDSLDGESEADVEVHKL